MNEQSILVRTKMKDGSEVWNPPLQALLLYLRGEGDIVPDATTVQPIDSIPLIKAIVREIERLRNQRPSSRFYALRGQLTEIEQQTYQMLIPLLKERGQMHIRELEQFIVKSRPEWGWKDIQRRIRKLGQLGWLERPSTGFYALKSEMKVLEEIS